MAITDNTVLPGPANVAPGPGMNPQIQAFLDLLMGGGLHGFGGFGGLPFGGFGQFLMNNPPLLRGLGLNFPGMTPETPVADDPAARAAAADRTAGLPSVADTNVLAGGAPGPISETPAEPLAGGGRGPGPTINPSVNPTPLGLHLPVNPPALPPMAGGPTGQGSGGNPLYSVMAPLLRKG